MFSKYTRPETIRERYCTEFAKAKCRFREKSYLKILRWLLKERLRCARDAYRLTRDRSILWYKIVWETISLREMRKLREKHSL